MWNWTNDAHACKNPEIIAGRLASMRNIYLREELNTIAKKIQEQYTERLPVLHLVTIAAYEQVFYRQPLSLPEELRRHAIKYGIEYYRHNIERLRMEEAQNGLYPNHDRLLCSDKYCPLHQSSNTLNSRDSISESTSNQPSRTETPKIIISRASNDSVSSNSTKKSSIRRDNDRTSARKRSKNIHRKRKDKRK